MERAPLDPTTRYVRGVLRLAVLLIFAFLLNIAVLSQVQHLVSQQVLRNAFAEQLASGTAPVSEGDFEDRLLPDGAPVALLQIPVLGVDEVVVEGTDGGSLKAGPGHRRDTVLPGQGGISVILGRASAYGGPLGRIQELVPGDTLSVVTGQGRQRFEVIGVRYAGDPSPPPPRAGQSRLVLETARGPAFVPGAVAYVDADLTGEAEASGARQTSYSVLPPAALPLATDTRTVWALVFALQFLVAAQLGAVWAYRRLGARKTWVVGVPVLGLALLYAADQSALLLPNLL